jgi:hypothetical protein
MISYISEGNGPGLVVSCVVPLFFTWVFSIIRVYVRLIMLKIWKIEDWLFIASQVCIFAFPEFPEIVLIGDKQVTFTILAVCALVTAVHGNGQHLISLSPVDIPIAMQVCLSYSLFLAHRFKLIIITVLVHL